MSRSWVSFRAKAARSTLNISVRCAETVDSEMEVGCGEVSTVVRQDSQDCSCESCICNYGLTIFKYRQNISRRIFKPRDRSRSVWTTSDAAFISLDVGHIVVFESHTHAGELVHCCFDIVHTKIQDGERGRGMVRFGI